MDPMISYAGNFEDVLLRRAFPSAPEGFYIDVGAYEPVAFSVTKHFSDRGWRGINIEPDPAPFALLDAQRPRDVNLRLGLSDHEGTLTLYHAPDAAHYAVDPEILVNLGARRETLVERTIPVTTLAHVCRTHVPMGQVIDFLKVDVEGHEAAVIRGGDWHHWRPRVLVIEACGPEAWEPLLFAHNYHFALFDGLNRIYVRDEDRHFLPILSIPVNTADLFWIHGYLARIDALQQRLDALEDLGPLTLELARRCRQTARQHPRLTAWLRPLLRRLAG